MYDFVSPIVDFVTGGSMSATEEASQQQQRAATASGELYRPYYNVGVENLNTLNSRVNAGPGDFTKSPGYDFRMQEGVNALERGAAARGKQLSGAQGKALTKFGQDYGSNEYQNWLNQWYQSLTPYQNLASTGLNAASGVGQGIMNTGEAQAAGAIGSSNILSSWLPMSPANWWSSAMGAGMGTPQTSYYNPAQGNAMQGGYPNGGYYNNALAGGGGGWANSGWANATMAIF